MHSFKTSAQSTPLLRRILYAASIAMTIAMLAVIGLYIRFDKFWDRAAVLLCNTLLWICPLFLIPRLHAHVGDGAFAVAELFCFFASFLGSVLNFYTRFWWYDVAMHTLFGYLACYFGLFCVAKLSDVFRLRPAFVLLVCFCLSMTLEALWEIFEFAGDRLFGNFAQGIPIVLPDGSSVTSVDDTMQDILCNLVGAAIFALQYLAHTISKKSLLIGYLKKDFSSKKPSPSADTPPSTDYKE